MEWFKWLVVVSLLFGMVNYLRLVCKGIHESKEQQKPLDNAVAAMVKLLLAIGVIAWL